MKSTIEILHYAKKASERAFELTTERKNTALAKMAEYLEKYSPEILQANDKDVEAAKSFLSPVMLDRLMLDEKRIRGMADGVRALVALDDPAYKVLSSHVCANGLVVEKTSVPFGVVAIIYESRPNVTSDAAALCLKSGNACVLRGGKEAYETSFAIVNALRRALSDLGEDENLVQMVEDHSRAGATELMTAVGYVDLLIPRGGAGLINACVENAKVPVIRTGTGICHIFVDESADIDKALRIIENAKASRPSVCNAEEVLLVHENIAPKFLPLLETALTTEREKRGLTPVKLKCDKVALKFVKNCEEASEKDFDTEFLDYILAVKVVKNVKGAVEHIAKHSTAHSESILTENAENAQYFTRKVDSAAVYVNASTRFTDGGEFGLGCEMGISTQKLHARGPMGLKELNTYKYIVKGDGQIR